MTSPMFRRQKAEWEARKLEVVRMREVLDLPFSTIGQKIGICRQGAWRLYVTAKSQEATLIAKAGKAKRVRELNSALFTKHLPNEGE